ncbi:ComEC/Rec2 family competence protein [Clostridium botulinum]|uniref:Competence protein ComE n=1 Tax=Clostridium botulinum TaxID=1491 RepID=A0A9Q1ZEN7_CLOBO|nr:ComEC/Rec2 family competence protein [Clostridium botulinum]AEB76517.1 ComE operon protein 3 [Clostridium botulinum BKT015925]KLU76101.1 competence protein ComE [Clostridium botulinum V891]KOA74034.1 competence protein ComE [Clostridium botulinum]KOA75412.1 competence protein ComE [Clostridium botulinum]KOA84924.1 competence protein ComE [Clostridium botulinum]
MDRPLIYYALSVYIACISLMILQNSVIMAIGLVLLFFIVLFLAIDIKSFILIISFFLVGCLSFYTYFNVTLYTNKNSVRIIQKKKGGYIGNYKGRKVILLGKFKNVKEGNRLIVSGKFSDNKDYSRGIIGEFKVDDYKKIKTDFIESLYIFRDKLYKKYNKLLGIKKSSIIMACCYGDTKYLSLDTKNEINRLGISHIISVSGLHIALVYKILESIFGIKIALIMSFVYMIFTGAKAATIRAYIMIVVLKFSKVVYKNYDSLSALSLAAIILLIMKPYYVMDIGFNLSFLATLGIILYNKKIKRVLYKLPTKINEGLSMTLSAQVFSMPYAMGTLNNISMFFILGNLILVPIYSMVILIGNIEVIFFNSDTAFDMFSKVLYSLLTAIDGGTYLLLKITPNVVQYNYFYEVSILSIFITYILYKHGYKRIIYFPIFVMCLVLTYSIV